MSVRNVSVMKQTFSMSAFICFENKRNALNLLVQKQYKFSARGKILWNHCLQTWHINLISPFMYEKRH